MVGCKGIVIKNRDLSEVGCKGIVIKEQRLLCGWL